MLTAKLYKPDEEYDDAELTAMFELFDTLRNFKQPGPYTSHFFQ